MTKELPAAWKIFFILAGMISYTTSIQKFDKQGEKTGWTYIEVPAAIAEQIKPGCRKSFKVKGRLDGYAIEQVSLMPMGDGNFIMALNATMRKGTGKRKGDTIKVQLTEDKKEYQLNKEFMECLEDEPAALAFFKAKPGSHQRYYSKWIESAKTEATRTKRIALAVSSLARKIDFAEMLHLQRDQKY